MKLFYAECITGELKVIYTKSIKDEIIQHEYYIILNFCMQILPQINPYIRKISQMKHCYTKLSQTKHGHMKSIKGEILSLF